jgi:hypothetical protein
MTHGASTAGPLWNFTTYHLNEPPNIPSNPAPANGTTGSSVNADLSWTGGDPNLGDTIKYDIYFDIFSPPTTKISENQSGVWYNPGGLDYNTDYYWQIVAWDNLNASATGPIWHFTTESSPPPLPSLKWSYVIAASGTSAVGPVVADVTNNGWMEVVRSGRDGIVVYNGSTGGVVWSLVRDMGDYHLPVEIIDLNKDGIPEIICSNGTGTMALHGNNGSVYWFNPNAPLYDKHPVAGDIDADGYPEVFVATQGKITALSHDGQIFASTYTYWPCWGGLSLGDTNYDGVFELYLNERSYYYQNNIRVRVCGRFGRRI